MDESQLIVGRLYEVFNPKYGSFTGELVELKHGDAIVKHAVAGIAHETVCNLSNCTLTPV